jgi:hypothetical protein
MFRGDKDSGMHKVILAVLCFYTPGGYNQQKREVALAALQLAWIT